MTHIDLDVMSQGIFPTRFLSSPPQRFIICKSTPQHTATAAVKPPHNDIVNQVLNLVLPFVNLRYLCCLDIGLLSLRESTSSAPHTCFPCTTLQILLFQGQVRLSSLRWKASNPLVYWLGYWGGVPSVRLTVALFSVLQLGTLGSKRGACRLVD